MVAYLVITNDWESQNCYWMLFSATRFLISRTPYLAIHCFIIKRHLNCTRKRYHLINWWTWMFHCRMTHIMRIFIKVIIYIQHSKNNDFNRCILFVFQTPRGFLGLPGPETKSNKKWLPIVPMKLQCGFSELIKNRFFSSDVWAEVKGVCLWKARTERYYMFRSVEKLDIKA